MELLHLDGKNFYAERRLGLVGDNFTKGKVLEKLPGILCNWSQSLFNNWK